MKAPLYTLPAHWQKWVCNGATKNSEGQCPIRFSDGSYALFEYAFYAVDEEKNELAVCTEHCGYHIFFFDRP